MADTELPLSNCFTIHLLAETAKRLPETSLLEAKLKDMIEIAHTTWPEIHIPDEAFLAYVAERVPADRPVDESLAELQGADLYLAKCCLDRDQIAISTFDKMLRERASSMARRQGLRNADCDDLVQDLRERILLGTHRNAPILQNYAGRGSLAGWLRVVVARLTLQAKNAHKPMLPIEDQLEAQIGLDGHDEIDPELAYLKARYLTEFRTAFRQAFSQLQVRDQNVLRYSVEQQLNIDQIGRIYGVHRATVARWLVSIRHSLLKKTYHNLCLDFGVERGEIQSILRIIESRLDISLGIQHEPSSV